MNKSAFKASALAHATIMHTVCYLFSVTFFLLMILMLPSKGFAESYNIGVLAKRGAEIAHSKWDSTADYLSDHIQGVTFKIVPLGFGDVESAVTQSSVDFLLVNPSIYVEMEAQYGVSRLATLKNSGPNGAHTLFGGVIFTRADNNEIHTLKDLKKGFNFMAVKENSLGGFQLAWNELDHLGINPYKDFSKLLFRSKHDLVVLAVLNGEVDAGTVRTDTLERMNEEGLINLDDFKIINEKQVSDFPYRVSTMLVPEWPFAKLKHIPDSLAQQVAIALMEMPPNSEAAVNGKNEGWTVPRNYQPIRNLLIDLKIGSFRQYGQLTFSKIIKQYWPMMLASFMIFLILSISIYYISRINRQLNRSRTKLTSEAEERSRIEQQLQESHLTLTKKITQYETTVERLKRIEKYHELTSSLVTCPNPKELLQKAVDQIVAFSGSLVGGVYVCDEDSGKLKAFVFHGMEDADLTGGKVAATLPALALTDRKLKHYSKALNGMEIRVQTGVGELVCNELLVLPLLTKDKPLGVIVLASLAEYPQEDLPFFGSMAEQVSVLLENSLAVDRLDQQHQQLTHEKREKDQLLNKMEHMANHDELTKLPNRRLFYDLTIKILQQAKRERTNTAVLFMDLDGFKQLNDLFGHAVGDSVLVDCAKTLQACMREHDIVARLGGDECIAVLTDIGATHDVIKVMDNIVRSVPTLAKRLDKDFTFGISIGCLISHPDQMNPETLIKQSDGLMYEAKAKGKGQYVIKDFSHATLEEVP